MSKASPTSSKRSVSRKKDKETRGRGRKGQDETEKLLTGAGWTTAATKHFIELLTDEEKFEHIKAMFSISNDEYQMNFQKTFTADFHLANGLFCQESEFDDSQTQFICKSMTHMLDKIVEISTSQEDINIDQLRTDLIHLFQGEFSEYNAESYKITPEQLKIILNFIETSLLEPIRMIIRVFQVQRYEYQMHEPRKIFAPPIPTPLSEFEELFPEAPPEHQFQPISFPHPGNLTLEEVKASLDQYTQDMINHIDARYDHLENMLDKVADTL